MRKIVVKNLKKETLLSNYLKKEFPSIVISKFYQSLRRKDIRVNDTKINKDINIKNGDILTIYISDEFLYDISKKIKSIYEDENILVVFKEQGILTNSDKNDEPTLESIVKENFNDSYVLMHRLDRNTAGLVIFAKTENAKKELFDAFKNGYINKYYSAYVSNSKFSKKHEIIEKYIVTDKENGYSKIYENKIQNSQKIITEYDVIKKDDLLDYAILKVKIHTGKTHQIRAVMNYINHPIIGDSKYGKNEINKEFNIYKQLLFADNYTFKFPNNYTLNYLNDINIKLNDNYIKDYIGSDKFGK